MKKFLFLALMACALIACDKKVAPQQKTIIGKWSEAYHVNTVVKSLTFYEDSVLNYEEKPDTTWENIPDWAGNYATLNYTIRGNKINIS